MFYYETRRRDLNRRLIYEYRCVERLRTETEGSKRFAYTGLCGGLTGAPTDRDEVKRREVEKMFVEYLIYTPEVVYYESIKRELKKRPVYECRCDERLKTKTEESTRLAYAVQVRVPD